MALQIGYILLIILLIPIVLGVVKIVNEGLSLSALAGLVFSVAVFGFGILLQMDTSDFSENFESSAKTILLEDNGEIRAGFTGVLTPDQPPVFLDENKIAQYNVYYQRGEQDKIKGESYKLIIVKRPAFEVIEKISFAGEDISREDAFAIIEASNPIEMYTERIVEAGIARNDIAPEYGDEAKKQYLSEIQEKMGDTGRLRGALFGVLIAEATNKQGPLFLLNSYHNRQVIIYEESFMFKIIKIIPGKILQFVSRQDIPIISNLLELGG